MKPSLRPRLVAAAVATLGGALGCSSGSSTGAAASTEDASVGSDGGVVGEDFVPTTADFDCLQDSEWTTIGVSRFKNMLGHTAEMLAVARSADGGVYPVGTMIQLVPTEASVKRGQGYSAQSDDWEFFTLDATSTGTTITASGGDSSVKNFTGLSCLGCHSKAAPQWDFVCGDVDGGNTHGCAALPLSGAELAMLQSTDPRCTAAAEAGADGAAAEAGSSEAGTDGAAAEAGSSEAGTDGGPDE
jgi:hypothetical protein